MAGIEELSSTHLPAGAWVRGKMIGSGSFGVVHLAIKKSNGALFVVKSSESQEGNLSLENEAKILETLDSPHIVQCLGKDVSFGENGRMKTNLFIEYMAAGSLGDVTERLGGKLDERVIRAYTREILKGLKYLHDIGIVHGDVKCQNVLLGSRGNIKLADFGCAKRTQPKSKNQATSNKFICGTPLWMAPEVLRNERLDSSSDIWSLGCTILEMATGKTPWGELGVSNPMAAILKIASSKERPSFPKEFSKDGLDFLNKCLVRVPEQRSTVDELLNHPFIKHELKAKNIEEKHVYENLYSPLSVLDMGLSDDGYESGDSDELTDMKLPFSVRRYEKRGSSQKQYAEYEMISHENWVTVRS